MHSAELFGVMVLQSKGQSCMGQNEVDEIGGNHIHGTNSIS